MHSGSTRRARLGRRNPDFSYGEFLIYDSINYTSKPSTSSLGMEEVRLVYEATLWDEGDLNEPDQTAIEAAAATVVAEGKPSRLVVLDIEKWVLDNREEDQETVEANRERMRTALGYFKAAAPGHNVGYYAFTPIRDYFTPVTGSAADIVEWKAANDVLRTLATDEDTLYPSLYTFYQDQAGWVTYAQANIVEARRMSPLKRIVPFIHPQIATAELDGDLLSGAYWTLILTTIRNAGCDGVVIWTGSNLAWDGEAGWWVATEAFLATV